jgi:hypothetical protein
MSFWTGQGSGHGEEPTCTLCTKEVKTSNIDPVLALETEGEMTLNEGERLFNLKEMYVSASRKLE